jgi:hypothetical protein
MRYAQNHYCDNNDTIQMCLNCTRKTCPGECPRVVEKGVKPRQSKLDKNDIGLKLVHMGLTDEKIALYMRMSVSSVRRWRMVNGVPAGATFRKKENAK